MHGHWYASWETSAEGRDCFPFGDFLVFRWTVNVAVEPDFFGAMGAETPHTNRLKEYFLY